GSTLVEQAIDHYVRQWPGRAVVQSAGNYFSKDIHASGRVRPNSCVELTWEVDEGDRTPNELDLWYSSRDRLRVELLTPDGTRLAALALGEQADFSFEGRPAG